MATMTAGQTLDAEQRWQDDEIKQLRKDVDELRELVGHPIDPPPVPTPPPDGPKPIDELEYVMGYSSRAAKLVEPDWPQRFHRDVGEPYEGQSGTQWKRSKIPGTKKNEHLRTHGNGVVPTMLKYLGKIHATFAGRAQVRLEMVGNKTGEQMGSESMYYAPARPYSVEFSFVLEAKNQDWLQIKQCYGDCGTGEARQQLAVFIGADQLLRIERRDREGVPNKTPDGQRPRIDLHIGYRVRLDFSASGSDEDYVTAWIKSGAKWEEFDHQQGPIGTGKMHAGGNNYLFNSWGGYSGRDYGLTIDDMTIALRR